MIKFPIGKSLLILGLVAAIVGGAVWYFRDKAAQAPEQRYRFQEVSKGEVVQTVSANGTLTPLILVNVGTQVSGTVRRLHVDFNQKVEKGQPLVELDQSLLEAQARSSAAMSETSQSIRKSEPRLCASGRTRLARASP